MQETHRLLRRQIKRFFPDPEQIPASVQAFVAAVNEAYWQAEEDRTRLERAIEISSKELLEANAQMQQVLHTVEAQVEERTAALTRSNAELEATLQELQETQTQLIQTEKMSSLGQLVAGIAHEINNPVSFIYGNLGHADHYTQTLLHLVNLYRAHYPEPDPEIQAALEESEIDFVTEDLSKLMGSMRVGVDRIKQIVLSLRNFSRMDEAEMKQVDIHEGIDSTLLLLQNRLKCIAGRADIEVIKEYGILPPIECYAGQLNQVFMNLVANAIDALEESDKFSKTPVCMPEEACLNRHTTSPQSYLLSTLKHQTTPRIWIRTEVTQHGWVIIRIVDNGKGIPEAHRQRLFDPFFTTKPVGKGTGLGLSISYQIITERHEGYLTCYSLPCLGTEFVIMIPAVQQVYQAS
ncbi:MAG: ATP-binding protein [Leptolyngbyaceae cyanobacterium bins.59]|nr:ATP-binding protein [Leptolyngbyaceae cyanobacterium bins.59]